MAAAALVISILSAVAAIAAVIYTRRVAGIEGDRRHDEQAPTFRVDLDYRTLPRTGAVEAPFIVVTYLDGPGELAHVNVRLVLAGQARPDPIVAIAGPLDEPDDQGAISLSLVSPPERLSPGEERLLRVGLNKTNDDAGTVPFRITSYRGKERWDATVYCEVPSRGIQVW